MVTRFFLSLDHSSGVPNVSLSFLPQTGWRTKFGPEGCLTFESSLGIQGCRKKGSTVNHLTAQSLHWVWFFLSLTCARGSADSLSQEWPWGSLLRGLHGSWMLGYKGGREQSLEFSFRDRWHGEYEA